MSYGKKSDYERGQEWFNQLTPHDKDELGNQFVLGTFDWMDWDNWFDQPPSAAFLNGAEYERLLWESGGRP